MPFAAVLSTAPATARALEEVCTRAREQFTGTPDLALAFYSPHHLGDVDRISQTIADKLSPGCSLGCVGEFIVGNDREVENEPALCLWLGSWQGRMQLESFHLGFERTADGPSLLGWPDGLISADPTRSAMLMLGDPFTFPVNDCLRLVNEDQPGLRIMGGMASGIRAPGQCRLLRDGKVHESGAVGVLLQGDAPIRGIVSQGCRPIGRHMIVTRGHDNIITELGGRQPLTVLQELWQELSPREQVLFQQGLFVGTVINEYQERFQRGDFLVRNVMGLEKETGALAIADRVKVGQTVQFHVRDAETADEDLRALLQENREKHSHPARGGLLFTCNGRGSRMFEEQNHDAKAVRKEVGNVPLAGFFAGGEIGPVGGQNFIHGFTASVVLFEE